MSIASAIPTGGVHVAFAQTVQATRTISFAFTVDIGEKMLVVCVVVAVVLAVRTNGSFGVVLSTSAYAPSHATIADWEVLLVQVHGPGSEAPTTW
jgi:hypothetical protein